jgi:hypothetical protein
MKRNKTKQDRQEDHHNFVVYAHTPDPILPVLRRAEKKQMKAETFDIRGETNSLRELAASLCRQCACFTPASVGSYCPFFCPRPAEPGLVWPDLLQPYREKMAMGTPTLAAAASVLSRHSPLKSSIRVDG